MKKRKRRSPRRVVSLDELARLVAERMGEKLDPLPSTAGTGNAGHLEWLHCPKPPPERR